MENWVLVDTCIWASFFSKPDSVEKRSVDQLIDADRVAVTGLVVAEVLLGFRRNEQADWVASRLRLAHCIEAGWDDWRTVAQLGRELAGMGQKLPLTDLLVATLAKRTGAWLYSSDPHFDSIPGLRRYRLGR